MKRKVIFILLAFVMVFSTFGMLCAAEYQYKDEYTKANKYPDLTWVTYDLTGKPKDHYHYALREIIQATNIGVMEGYPDGYFKPDEPIIRCEFIKMLVSLATNKNFDFGSTDSEYKDWYGPYVTIAEMQGLIEKNEYTVEELQEPITRIEMILMLAKTQIYMKGIPQTQIGTLKYTDLNKLTQDERDLVLHAADYDLLEGMKDGTETLLYPNKYLTRGEAAAALMRIY
mgnify:CR=1 FL=1